MTILKCFAECFLIKHLMEILGLRKAPNTQTYLVYQKTSYKKKTFKTNRYFIHIGL